MLPAKTSTPRSNRGTLRLVLVVLVLIATGTLLGLVASRPGTGPAVGVGGPTGQPSGSARSGASDARPGSSDSRPGASDAGPRASGAAGFDPARVAVTLEPYVDGLNAPLAIVNAGDGSGRLFVVQQGGQIRVIRDGKLQPAPFLDIGDQITTGGERGLLGLAFDPHFASDGRIFVDYTDANGDTQVSSFNVSDADPNVIDRTSETKVLSVKQPYANHNGGALVFDPAGLLLVSLGDGGSGGDPQGNGQSLETLLGKILRIDVSGEDAEHPYRIPADNPYRDGADGHRPEIWLWGLRNPWRMSIDRATGDLWIGDVGQNAWEEIDVQRAGVPGGTNFGWSRMEGTHCFAPATGCEDDSLTRPVSDYGHDLGCTVIGGNVYRGTAQTALVGGYLFGDYCSGRIWAIDPAGDGYRQPVQVADSGRSLAAFGEDEAGELYAADIRGGAILRMTATRR